MSFTVLIVDDELEMCLSMEEILTSHGLQVRYATDPRRAVSLLKADDVNLALLDIRMPDIPGLELLKTIKEARHWVPVIMITGYPSMENAVKAMKYGALNVYEKPLDIPALLAEIDALRLAAERQGPTGQARRIITRNGRMAVTLNALARAAPSDVPVLVTGESGTGKELVAHSLHEQSTRAGRPLIKVNCASIPDSLLENELFGHEKGAFTDAHVMRKGKFELAGGGSMFFDEIGEMSIHTQAKLLRVLQEGEFERLGGSQTLKADVRIIAATNKDLATMIRQGLFREDLYYRLAVVTIDVPPLRERRDDVLLIAGSFLREFNAKYGKSITGFTPELERIFLGHSWPGNVRELRNCVERAVIFSESDMISVRDLPAQYAGVAVAEAVDAFQGLYSTLSRELIQDALERTSGVKKKAAELLHVTRKTLYNKMKKLGMQ